MKPAILLATEHVISKPLCEWLVKRCRIKGVALQCHAISSANRGDYKRLFNASANVITWGFKMPHAWMSRDQRNVLYIENSLVHQPSGIFVDHGGYFADSNLCKRQVWREDHSNIDLETVAREKFGWPLFSGGNPKGPVLVSLQMSRDAPLRYYFPAGRNAADKVHATLELLRQHLPKGRPVLIRPHPRERANFDTGGIWRDDWQLDMQGSFAERLKQCSALVTVNSTCATEAALLGIPTATLGNGSFTGSGVTLECASNPTRLAGLFDWQPDLDACRSYVGAILNHHFMPFSAIGVRCREFERWLARAADVQPAQTVTLSTPDHLGGHSGKTHVDAGALKWVKGRFRVESMLDIGCGPAEMQAIALTEGIKWTGIDGDPACAGKCIISHDFERGAPEVEAVDLAWSTEFLEHVHECYLSNVMSVFKRARHVVVTHAKPGKHGHHHVNCRTMEYWIGVFERHGFTFDARGTLDLRDASSMKRDFMRNSGLLFHRVG